MNTTSLIAHEMSTNLSSRPDLALTYYPSKFEFYWFVSRSYSLLNRRLSTDRRFVTSPSLDQVCSDLLDENSYDHRNMIWAAPWQNQPSLQTLLQIEKMIASFMDPDQTAWMCKLVWIHACRKHTVMVFCRGAAHYVFLVLVNEEMFLFNFFK
jgi:hypothetical protein